MTTTKEMKKLSVSQYEFYKKADVPMADLAIAKIYGMNINQLNAFKQENDLIGKYRKKSQTEEKKESTLYTGKKVEVKPLREKEVIRPTNRITERQVMERHEESSQKPASEVFESEPAPTVEKSNIAPVSNTAIDYAAMLVENSVHSDESLQIEDDKEIISDLKEHLELLQFQLAESKDNAAGWERKYKKEYECSEMWRDRFLQIEEQQKQRVEQLNVEVDSRKEAQRLMDEALTAAYQDEKLAVMLAEKFVMVSKRNLEAN